MHESKCRNIHGHNYVVLFTAQQVAGNLDNLGRVIDFSVLKEKLGGWIDQYWDHGFIYWEQDEEMRKLFGDGGLPAKLGDTSYHSSSPLMKHKSFAIYENPTAENMARYLLRIVCPPLLEGTSVRVTKVTLWETENCFAEVTL